MKALSIRQPWAWLIVNGYKSIENRTWCTKTRGPVLIHAAQEFDHVGCEFVRSKFGAIALAMPGFIGRWRRSDWQLGGIVGRADVVGCIAKGCSELESDEFANDHQSPFFTGPFGFVLRNPSRLPFVSLPGKLGFFDVPDEIGKSA